MYKKTALLSLVLFVMISHTVAHASQKITVVYNEMEIQFNDQQPVLKDGRTLVPVSAIFEAFDMTVTWDSAMDTVTATNSDYNIILQIDNLTAYVNDDATLLDVPAEIMNGRTMVPIRFISESLGMQVHWNENTSVITITKSNSGGEINIPSVNSSLSAITEIHPAFLPFKDLKGFDELYGKNRIGQPFKTSRELNDPSYVEGSNLTASQREKAIVELIIPRIFENGTVNGQPGPGYSQSYTEWYIISYNGDIYVDSNTYGEYILDQNAFKLVPTGTGTGEGYWMNVNSPVPSIDFSFEIWATVSDNPEISLMFDSNHLFTNLKNYDERICNAVQEQEIDSLNNAIIAARAEIDKRAPEIEELKAARLKEEPDSYAYSYITRQIAQKEEFLKGSYIILEEGPPKLEALINFQNSLKGKSVEQYQAFINSTQYK